jgi:hypothetical protein
MKIGRITISSLILSITLIDVCLSLMLMIVYAQASQSASGTPTFLAIQHAAMGSVSEINSTSYSLQFDDISNKIVLFSERPNRIVQTQTVDNFIGNWTRSQDSFRLNPPNGALVMLNNNKEDVFEIELFNPIYDKNQKSLKYEFNV